MAGEDYARYQSLGDASLVARFKEYIAELDRLNAKNGWELEKNFRTSWCSFKPPKKRDVAFGMAFGKGGVYLYIKWVENEAQSFPVKMSDYDETNHQVEFILEPRVKQLDAFMPLLKLAYERSTE